MGLETLAFSSTVDFFKEFGRRGGNQTVLEQVKETGKRIAYELYGPIFRRQVMEDVARSSSSTASANLSRICRSE